MLFFLIEALTFSILPLPLRDASFLDFRGLPDLFANSNQNKKDRFLAKGKMLLNLSSLKFEAIWNDAIVDACSKQYLSEKL